MAQVADSPYGSLSYANGEVENRSKVADPPAYRGGTTTGGGLVKFSGDRIRADGALEECVLLQFKEDERFPGSKAGEVTLHLRRPNSDGDQAMALVMTLRHDGIAFHVPASVAASSAPPSFMRSLDGRYEIHIQGDGNFVVYDTRVSGWKALWSWMTGKLP